VEKLSQFRVWIPSASSTQNIFFQRACHFNDKCLEDANNIITINTTLTSYYWRILLNVAQKKKFIDVIDFYR